MSSLCAMCKQELANTIVFRKKRNKNKATIIKFIKPEGSYLHCLEDLVKGQIVLTPTNRKAKVLKLREANTAHRKVDRKDKFARVLLQYLDEEDDLLECGNGVEYGINRVTLQPHLLRII
jgi:hypothetical protein|tara:strand:+ start:441 stop:800 length:360 start_codon:yes stop_codon:yes gene_type:complete